MAYGLTPYDKKRYKQSKKRRRQAYFEEKTGKIIPAANRKRNIIILIISLLLTAGMIVGFCFAVNYYTEQGKVADKNTQNSQKEIFLSVVNKRKPLEKDYVPDTVKVQGTEVAQVVKTDLENMLKDAEKQGIKISLTGGYISFEEQQSMYEERFAQYLANPDYTEVRAEAAAANEIPPGGMSESQTGLLFEFKSENSTAQQWLENNCVYYGFVLRYPKNKKTITSKEYNPSLFRYTGAENALKMRSFDMCLEEYNEYIQAQLDSLQ
jgi:D-alanyl-D-alanine carboxypeptidase